MSGALVVAGSPLRAWPGRGSRRTSNKADWRRGEGGFHTRAASGWPMTERWLMPDGCAGDLGGQPGVVLHGIHASRYTATHYALPHQPGLCELPSTDFLLLLLLGVVGLLCLHGLQGYHIVR
jgi:hypothetical protein